MAGGVGRRVGVVEVGDLFVPVGGEDAARIRTGNEGRAGVDLELGLEGEVPIGLVAEGVAAVDEEDRDRNMLSS